MAIKENWIYALETLFTAKKYTRDMIWDFCSILSMNIMSFQDEVDEFEKNRAEEYLREIVAYSKKPQSRYRMYIVCGIQYVAFAWTEIQAEVLQEVRQAIEYEFGMCEMMNITGLDPNLISTLYLFEGDDIVLMEHMYPTHLAWLLQSLSKYNLVKRTLQNG